MIPALNANDQYQLGVQAGEILRKMHDIPAEPNQVPWAEYYNAKINNISPII